MILEVYANCNVVRLAGGGDLAPEKELVAIGETG